MSTTTAQPAAPSRDAPRFGAKRVLLLVIGGLVGLFGLLVLAAGGAAVWGLTQRDDSGYFSTGTGRLSTPSFALASSSLDIGPAAPRLLGEDFATVRLQATSARPVFVGIGPSTEVGRYLGRVQHREITDFDTDPFRVTSHGTAGGETPAPPASQRFWAVQTSGTGTQTIKWPVEKGSWSAVVMNADGSRNVAVGLRIGARIPALGWVAFGLIAAGLVVLLLGGVLIYLGARRPRAPAPA